MQRLCQRAQGPAIRLVSRLVLGLAMLLCCSLAWAANPSPHHATDSRAGAAGAEPEQFRFPPPEFESGYQLPVTTTPAPRSWWFHYVDVLVLVGALALATHLALNKRSRKGLVALSIFSLAYFGFYRKGCVCAIGSIQNVSLALFSSGYALPIVVAAFFFAPLLAALFAGRTFCSAVCPHGAIQDLVLLRPLKVPQWLEQGLSVIPFIYLGAGIVFAATGSAFIICEFDPFIPIFRLGGSTGMVSLGVGLLVLGVFVGRPYCRFLCPYGALLRLGAIVSAWRVTVTPDVCTQCQLCTDACPYGALRLPSKPMNGAEALRRDRRRLGILLLLLPVLVTAGGWGGSKLSVAASRVNPHVALAERYMNPETRNRENGPQTAEALSLKRAAADPTALVAQALDVRRRFVAAGTLFGVWVGLVIGVKLISLSLRRTRTDYEPDRGACLACARCFASCPNERARLGQCGPERAELATEGRGA